MKADHLCTWTTWTTLTNWTTLTTLTDQWLIKKIIAEFALITWSCIVSPVQFKFSASWNLSGMNLSVHWSPTTLLASYKLKPSHCVTMEAATGSGCWKLKNCKLKKYFWILHIGISGYLVLQWQIWQSCRPPFPFWGLWRQMSVPSDDFLLRNRAIRWRPRPSERRFDRF